MNRFQIEVGVFICFFLCIFCVAFFILERLKYENNIGEKKKHIVNMAISIVFFLMFGSFVIINGFGFRAVY